MLMVEAGFFAPSSFCCARKMSLFFLLEETVIDIRDCSCCRSCRGAVFHISQLQFYELGGCCFFPYVMAYDTPQYNSIFVKQIVFHFIQLKKEIF